MTDGKNKYSVPFDLIGEEVHIRLTSRTIEAFFNGSRVASFPRETVQKGILSLKLSICRTTTRST
ncbi:MAG: Mu transposase domain-containing protein [Limnochordia bacterium]